MKDKIIKFGLISLTTTIISYLLVSFVKWDVLWIKDIPTYSNWDRGGIIWGYCVKLFIDWLLSLINTNK